MFSSVHGNGRDWAHLCFIQNAALGEFQIYFHKLQTKYNKFL